VPAATAAPTPRLFRFIGGAASAWQLTKQTIVCGEPLAPVNCVDMVVASSVSVLNSQAAWTLHGVTSNERYVTRPEKSALVEKQQGLGRATSTMAALIPIRKSAAWWALTQDERRDVMEVQSHHIAIGMKYLPAIARRLHHCRDLGSDEPFDFITWFEFAAADSTAFDDLLGALRSTPEWAFVDREVDIRLVRNVNA
jgi:chlorite dismutase